MINQVTLVGRLTRDPELRNTADGTAVAHITLAVNRNFRNHNGEIDTDFVQCTLWRKAAQNTHHYCRKGAVIGITGRLQTRNYEGRDGKKVYVTEVVAESVRFLSGRVPESAHGGEPQTAAQAAAAQAAAIAAQAAAMHSGGMKVPAQGGQSAGTQFGAQNGAGQTGAGQAAATQFGGQAQAGQSAAMQFGGQQTGQAAATQFGGQVQAGQVSATQVGGQSQVGQAAATQSGGQSQAGQAAPSQFGAQQARAAAQNEGSPTPPTPSENKGEVEYAF